MNKPICPSSDSTVVPLNRRQLLTLASTATAGTWLGCQPKREEQVETVRPRTDVPLRVVWVGDADDIEAVQRGWRGVDELPLDIQHVSLDLTDASKVIEQLRQRGAKSDVIVAPLMLVADAFAEGLIGDLGSDSAGGSRNAEETLPAGLRSGAARYAGKQIGHPLGCHPWALMASEQVEADQVVTWDDYDRLASDLSGRVGEPDSPGWCGLGFLLRASSVIDQGWLFDRETMQPTIADPSYVEMLEMMKRAVSLGDGKKRSPEQVGHDIATGELDMGIGVLQANQVETADLVAVQGLPSGRTNLDDQAPSIAEQDGDLNQRSTRTTRPMLLPPLTMVGMIADSCRQTSSARRWLDWLRSGEGMADVWSQSSRLGPTLESTGGASVMGAQDAYSIWSQQSLRRSAVRPCMQLIQGPVYYQALDKAVTDCVHGGMDAKQQLEGVARRWQALTDEVGISSQKRAWQRASGRAV